MDTFGSQNTTTLFGCDEEKINTKVERVVSLIVNGYPTYVSESPPRKSITWMDYYQKRASYTTTYKGTQTDPTSPVVLARFWLDLIDWSRPASEILSRKIVTGVYSRYAPMSVTTKMHREMETDYTMSSWNHPAIAHYVAEVRPKFFEDKNFWTTLVDRYKIVCEASRIGDGTGVRFDYQRAQSAAKGAVLPKHWWVPRTSVVPIEYHHLLLPPKEIDYHN